MSDNLEGQDQRMSDNLEGQDQRMSDNLEEPFYRIAVIVSDPPRAAVILNKLYDQGYELCQAFPWLVQPTPLSEPEAALYTILRKRSQAVEKLP